MANPQTASQMTPELQHDLYAETDARFWAQTGYKPGKKLDPKNPLDAKMVPTYTDIYNKVVKEQRAGKLVTTHDHPAIVADLNDAAANTTIATNHLESAKDATKANKPELAAEHAAAAQTAHAAATVAAHRAAVRQPPTVSAVHVGHAAHQIQQFVMGAGGQGIAVGPPVPLNGEDMSAAIQATAAPAIAASVAAAAPPGSAAAGPSTTALAPLHHALEVSSGVLIAGGIAAAALGIAYFATRKTTRRSSPRRASRPRTTTTRNYYAGPTQGRAS